MASIYHLKYQATFSGLSPRTESIVTDMTSGEINEMISSAPMSRKLAEMDRRKPLV
jgi:hypothetical protein